MAKTDYTMVRLMKNKSASEVKNAVRSMKLELKSKGANGMEVVRLHSDFDPSFQAEVRQSLLDDEVVQTDTGGYRPQNNSRTERRIRMLTEVVKANLIVATAGIQEYDSLWGPALQFAADRVNQQIFEDGRCPHRDLTGREPELEQRDNIFGEQATIHIPKEKRVTKWDASGGRSIWVGKSVVVTDGHKVVPIEWDASVNAWQLGNVENVATAKVVEGSMVLREGPNGFVTPSEQIFYEKFNLAKYHVTPAVAAEQTDPGYDPKMVVEEITGHKGKGKRRKYKVKWEGHEKQTYEPLHHLTGCQELVEEYSAKLKKKEEVPRPIPKRKVTRRSTRSAAAAIKVDEDVIAVEELLRKQKVAGSVEDWLPGYKKELNNITENRLQPITDAEEMKIAKEKAVPIRMNLEPKRDGRKKGRLIVQGFKEMMQWLRGQTDSPVASLSTIRSLLFMGTNEDTIWSSIDLIAAFIQSEKYGPNEPPRYVSFKRHKQAKKEYYKLTGPLYGQRDAPMRWFKTFEAWLIEEGFTPGKNDPCIFIKEGIRVVLWVDDVLVRATKEKTEEFYARLMKRFDAKDPEYLTPESHLGFLGFDIRQYEIDGQMAIGMDQQVALNRFLDDWNTKYTPGIKCPMPNAKEMYTDTKQLGEQDAKAYQQIVGALNYFAMTTRYDIAHATSRLSQMSAKPTKGAAKALKRVMRYLRANDKLVLEGVITKKNDLESYSDSDHAGDKPNLTQSQTGMVITLNGVPVHWASRKQVSTTAISSAIAEIYALSETVKSTQLTVWKLEELGVTIPYPIVVQVDNTQAISFQRGTCLVSKLRGMIDLRWAWVSELRNKNLVSVTKVSTEKNKADMFTKCMPAYKFRLCMRELRRDQETRHVAKLVQVLSS